MCRDPRFHSFAVRLAIVLLLSPCHLVTLSPCHAGYDEVIDSPMYKSPELPVRPVETTFPEGAIALWVKALERPETDLKCQAAQAVSKAQRRGVKGLEITVGPLRAALDKPEQHPTVRLAVAEALITLQARDAAPSLLQTAQSGAGELRELVEPALARWDFQPARALWLERLREPSTPQRNLVLAIQGLAAVHEGQAADRLRELALSDGVAGPIRLEAARALGTLRPEDLEKDAERLAADPSARGVIPRLLAASLLRQHRGEAAIALLKRLGEDAEPTVAAVAVARLLEIDPELLVPTVEHLLASPDANLRGFGVEVLFRRPTQKHVRLLGDQLDDPHPSVRVKARHSLEALGAKEEWHKRVLAEGERMLASEKWRGVEQAAILLTQLDHKPAAQSFVKLLTFDRPEVFVTAAWGLRRLAVPETVPAVADHVKAEMSPPNPKKYTFVEMDLKLSQLNQFLGQQKYEPAEATLRKFVPHVPTQPLPESRGAAIWALGLIREGKPDVGLAKELEARINDRSIPPEEAQVRLMSAITIGRMDVKESVDTLRGFCPENQMSGEALHDACAWALGRLTGEAMAPPKTFRPGQLDWFLTPFR
jgi:HEAT repeat protein